MQLKDTTVIDFTHSLPGPYATQLLTDLGAEVIKVEPPSGDPARTMEITGEKSGGLFELVNRGKKSMTVDLKQKTGREVIYRLIENADVVIEQFRPGVVDDLGIAYDDLRKHNAELVYCSVTGYGQTGPYADRVGHDLNYIGVAGLLDMTRKDESDSPVIPGYPIGDMAGGMAAALSIISALYNRAANNGGGDYIDVSITDATLSFAQVIAANVMFGDVPHPGKTALTGKYPCYDVYETKDGKFVTLAALEPKFWDEFCEVVGREDLKEDHRASDEAIRERVREELSTLFRSKTCLQWERELKDHDVMFGRVNSSSEALTDPQFEERSMIMHDGKGAPRLGFPAQFTSQLAEPCDPAPMLGEHTTEVLRNIGYADEKISSLRKEIS